MRAKRWIDNSKIEIVSETAASRLDSSTGEGVAQQFIIELSRGEAKIIKTYAEKGASPGGAANRWPALCLALLYEKLLIAIHARPRQGWLIFFSLGASHLCHDSSSFLSQQRCCCRVWRSPSVSRRQRSSLWFIRAFDTSLRMTMVLAHTLRRGMSKPTRSSGI